MNKFNALASGVVGLCTPKVFINYYSFRHNIFMGNFSFGKRPLLSSGVFIFAGVTTNICWNLKTGAGHSVLRT